MDPKSPLIYHVLSGVLDKLEFSVKAREADEKALEFSTGLRREERLRIEASYWAARNKAAKAMEIYRTLFEFFPDNLDYGIALASEQLEAGMVKSSLATLAALRQLPSPFGDDPWLDYWEAKAHCGVADYDACRRVARIAIQRGRQRGARFLVAIARAQEAVALYAQGNLQEALTANEDADRLFLQSGHGLGVRRVVGGMRLAMGDVSTAILEYQEAERRALEIGSQVELSRIRNGFARALRLSGNLALARQKAELALAMAMERKFDETIINFGRTLGDISRSEGNLVEARRRYEESLRITKGRDDDSRSFVWRTLGQYHTDAGDLAAARKSYEAALTIFPWPSPDAAGTRRDLAALDVEAGRLQAAEKLAREAAQEFQREKAPDDEASARAVLAWALLEQGRPAAAEEALYRASELMEKSQNLPVRLEVMLTRGRVRLATGEPADLAAARQAATAALAEASKTGFVPEQFEARLLLGGTEIWSGRSAAGIARLRALAQEAQSRGFGLIARKSRALRP